MSYTASLRALAPIRGSLMRACAPSSVSQYHATAGALADDSKSPVEGQLYGRPDRDPAPSPNKSVAKDNSANTDGEAANSPQDAYPVAAAEDPSVTTENASPTGGRPLPQNEDAGPKAAGQGRLATTKDDYGGPASSGEQPQQQGKDA